MAGQSRAKRVGAKKRTPARRGDRSTGRSAWKAEVVSVRADGRHVVKSIYESTCGACPLPIKYGDEIVRGQFGEWEHDRCCELWAPHAAK